MATIAPASALSFSPGAIRTVAKAKLGPYLTSVSMACPFPFAAGAPLHGTALR